MDKDKFTQALDDSYDWPCAYMFKFIVPINKVNVLLGILGEDGDIVKRPSKKGNYISITFTKIMESSQDVFDIYVSVKGVEGLVSL